MITSRSPVLMTTVARPYCIAAPMNLLGILLHLVISLDSERLNDIRKKSIISQKIIDEKVKAENKNYYYIARLNIIMRANNIYKCNKILNICHSCDKI